jgi:hypothetical protein
VAVLAESGEGADVLARLAATLEGIEDEERGPALRMLSALEEMLRRNEGG